MLSGDNRERAFDSSALMPMQLTMILCGRLRMNLSIGPRGNLDDTPLLYQQQRILQSLPGCKQPSCGKSQHRIDLIQGKTHPARTIVPVFCHPVMEGLVGLDAQRDEHCECEARIQFAGEKSASNEGNESAFA